MKKLALLLGCAVAFFLIAAPIYMNYDFHNVQFAGQPQLKLRAALVNGQWAVPLEDFSRALGGNGITLEPMLKLQGTSLTVTNAAESADHKHKVVEASAAPNTIGGSSVNGGIIGPSDNKVYTNAIIAVRKAGGVSNNVFTVNGQKFVPLADIARAFGGTFTSPRDPLKPGESLSLNFANNPNAVLGYQSGGHQ